MPRQSIFSADTTLYHPTEGKRCFPAGEQDPGPAWHDTPGGKPVGEKSTKAAMADLSEAQSQIADLNARLEAQAHDMAQAARVAEEATAKVAGLEQDLIAARAEAAEHLKVSTDLNAAHQKAVEYGKTLEGRLDAALTAGETVAAENAALKAQVAKFDADGDGKTGGSKPKKTTTPKA